MFRENRARLAEAYAILQDLPTDNALRSCLVLEGLRHLMHTTSEFDETLVDNSLLKNHFFSDLASLPQNDESHWFSLLELLALLFKEHALRNPGVENSPIALRILTYFEESSEWNPDDGTLASRWYWVELPERYQH